jgi:hypothetical protein
MNFNIHSNIETKLHAEKTKNCIEKSMFIGFLFQKETKIFTSSRFLSSANDRMG